MELYAGLSRVSACKTLPPELPPGGAFFCFVMFRQKTETVASALDLVMPVASVITQR